jgi:ribosome maturation factor RimP
MPSTANQTLAERIGAIAARAAAREGMEVWDVEVAGAGRNRVVRIYIDKPEGISHADCELISEQVGTVLDVEDVVPGAAYHLEVSSPGLERRLRHEGDFQRYQGRKARVVLREPAGGQRRWETTIGGVEDGWIVLETSSGKSIRVRMDQIEKANLKFEW